MKGLLLSLVTLSACVAGSLAVRCYDCTGTVTPFSSNPWCNDQFDDTSASAKASIKTCDGPCVKLYSKIGDTIEGYQRQCANGSSIECINDCASVGEIYSCIHCCDTDLCNSAGAVTFNLLAAVAMLVSAWAFTS